MTSRKWALTNLITLVVFSMSISCDRNGGDECAETTLDCPCGPGGECEGELACVSDVCVEPSAAWFESSCEELGGTELSEGACYFPCTSSDECSFGTDCCAWQYNPFCRMCNIGCQTDEECGPAGWACENGNCWLRCTTSTGDEPSSECPPGYSCGTDSYVPVMHCSAMEDTSSCGVECAPDCCSPSGLTCCAPPFCSGDCVGSPCC